MTVRMLCEVVFARQQALDGLAREFQRRQTHVDTSYVMAGLLLVACLVVVVWLASRILDRQRQKRPFDNSWFLFLTLCREHRLRLREAWLLFRVVLDQKLKDPARLFLEPKRLSPAALGPMLRRRSAELGRLARKIYGTQPDSSANPSHSSEPLDSLSEAQGQ